MLSHPRVLIEPGPGGQRIASSVSAPSEPLAPGVRAATTPTASIEMPLHPVGTNQMAGMMEELAGSPYEGRADLPEADELLPLGETLQLLHFAVLEEGDIQLTEEGRRFAVADTEERKRIFAAALLAHVPLARRIRQVLDERPNHRASAVRFRDELEDRMSPDYAEDTLRTVIAWVDVPSYLVMRRRLSSSASKT